MISGSFNKFIGLDVSNHTVQFVFFKQSSLKIHTAGHNVAIQCVISTPESNCSSSRWSISFDGMKAIAFIFGTIPFSSCPWALFVPQPGDNCEVRTHAPED